MLIGHAASAGLPAPAQVLERAHRASFAAPPLEIAVFNSPEGHILLLDFGRLDFLLHADDL